MKNKIKNILNNLYKLIKEDIWPYKYYVLISLVFATTFTLEMLTWTRIITFIITFLVLIMYKKVHEYIEKKEFANFNIKYVIYLMWINTMQNPILYLVWKWDLYVYDKLNKLINKNIKNKILNIIFIGMLLNISLPLKILYIRCYMVLAVIKMHTFVEFMFHRIYGFIISILILSDIIKYIYQVTGGWLNVIIYIYLIIYGINVIYTYFYYFLNKRIIIVKFNQYLISKIIKIYFNIVKKLNIGIVYEKRIEVSIIGNCIKKIVINNFNFIKNLNTLLYKIPENWRFWIYEMRLVKFYESYWDNIIRLKMNIIKLETLKININYNNEISNYNYDIYLQLFNNLRVLFKTFEAVIYYKYYVYNKGYKEYDKYAEVWKKPQVLVSEYIFTYTTLLLILKNLLHFMWSFEYNILKDKSKITKCYVIKDTNLEYGFHIYLKDIKNFSPYDHFDSNNLINRELYLQSKNNDSNEFVYESIQVLLNVVKYKDMEHCMYIGYLENKQLKNLDLWYNKNIKKFNLNNWYENDLSLLKPEIASEYFSELNDVINILYNEWESAGASNIFKERAAFKALVNHITYNNIIK